MARKARSSATEVTAPFFSTSDRDQVLNLFRERFKRLNVEKGKDPVAAAILPTGHVDFVQLLRIHLERLRNALTDAKKDLARFLRNLPKYPWPDGNPQCFAKPFEIMLVRLGKREFSKAMKRPKAAGLAFVNHGLAHYYNETEIPRVTEVLIRAIDGLCFEGDGEVLKQLRTARLKLPRLNIRDALLIRFWYDKVTLVINRKYAEHFDAIPRDEWFPWHLWIGVCEKLVELASNAGDWTQPINKRDLQTILGHYHRGWSDWLAMHASALRPAGGGTLRSAKQIRVNLASTVLPIEVRDGVKKKLAREAEFAAKEARSLRKSARKA